MKFPPVKNPASTAFLSSTAKSLSPAAINIPAVRDKSNSSQQLQNQNAPSHQEHYLHWLLKYFPTVSTSYVFGYGPCLITKGKTEHGRKKERVDLVFVVDEPFLWHRRNLSMNPEHYSFLKYFGPNVITKIQNNWAAGIYYNPFVTINNKLIKYGVISTASLNNDLKHWSHLYIAGRLHKPVLELYPPSAVPELVENLRRNQMYALRMTLLQLPAEFTKYELYYGITSLSYIGDFRLYIEEDPKQIRDMILPLMDQYDRIYLPLLKSLSPLVTLDKRRNLICQVESKDTILQHLLALPLAVQLNLAHKFKFPIGSLDIEEIMFRLCKIRHIDMYALQSLRSIVTRSTLKQTLQGIFTAGLFKAIWYGVDKIERKLASQTSTRQAKGGGHGTEVGLKSSLSSTSSTSGEFGEIVTAGPSLKHKNQPKESSVAFKKTVVMEKLSGGLPSNSQELDAVLPTTIKTEILPKTESKPHN